MRALSAVVTLATLAVPSAFAQKLWQPEIGIRGGYARIKPAGTGASDAIDLYDIPGSNFLDFLASYGTVYAVVPLTNRMAVEPSLNMSQSTPAFLAGTHITFGLRVDYAITRNLYAAAGGALAYVSGGGTSVRQVGVQGAAGVRLGPGRGLSGRLEVQTILFHKTADLGPYNVYAITFGVSGRLSSTAGSARPPRRDGFEPALGFQGGYSHSHVVGSGGSDLITLSVPGGGSSGFVGIVLGTRPTTLFVILPVRSRLGVDLGVDAHQFQASALLINGAIFSGQLTPRLALAVGNGWYAAAGPTFHIVRSPTTKLSAASGAMIGWGYRFPLAGQIGGRAELSYSATAAHNGIGFQAVNTLALMFGALFPLR